jgi:inorganic phosphate transporter, PiT family
MLMAIATGATSALESKLGSSAGKAGKIGVAIFGLAMIAGFIYAADHLITDLYGTHSTGLAFVLLGIALLTALGFEFVNGFHDTANAVATVIYTHSLEPHLAVVWSGLWNFLGVLVSSGAVAFGIISLLPVERFCKSEAAPDSPWCSRSWWRPSSGTWALGTSDFRRRAPIRSWDR